jgi:hypothetical protein
VRTRSTLCCLLAVFIAGAVATAATGAEPNARPRIAGPHVRPVTPRVARLLEEAIARSPTFAALVAAIDKSDVIVHVEEVHRIGHGIEGRLSFIYANDDVRYLRAQVRAGRGAVDTMAVVGHELQHALEVALHDNVRDEKAFTALYVRIGDRPDPHRFDTAAAREVGSRVRKELN